jgi:hypothetical protein
MDQLVGDRLQGEIRRVQPDGEVLEARQALSLPGETQAKRSAGELRKVAEAVAELPFDFAYRRVSPKHGRHHERLTARR